LAVKKRRIVAAETGDVGPSRPIIFRGPSGPGGGQRALVRIPGFRDVDRLRPVFRAKQKLIGRETRFGPRAQVGRKGWGSIPWLWRV